MLLVLGDCMWLKHSLLACLGAFHSTIPSFGAALGTGCKRHSQRGAYADEVDTSVLSPPVDTLICISGWLTAAGDPKRQCRG